MQISQVDPIWWHLHSGGAHLHSSIHPPSICLHRFAVFLTGSAPQATSAPLGSATAAGHQKRLGSARHGGGRTDAGSRSRARGGGGNGREFEELGGVWGRGFGVINGANCRTMSRDRSLLDFVVSKIIEL